MVEIGLIWSYIEDVRCKGGNFDWGGAGGERTTERESLVAVSFVTSNSLEALNNYV